MVPAFTYMVPAFTEVSAADDEIRKTRTFFYYKQHECNRATMTPGCAYTGGHIDATQDIHTEQIARK